MELLSALSEIEKFVTQYSPEDIEMLRRYGPLDDFDPNKKGLGWDYTPRAQAAQSLLDLLSRAERGGVPFPEEEAGRAARAFGAGHPLMQLMRVAVQDGPEGYKLRRQVVADAARQGLLPPILFHGTNDRAVAGIAKQGSTRPEVSWQGEKKELSKQAPKTYWTPQPETARGMAIETSKVGNVREELRHKALQQKPAAWKSGMEEILDNIPDKMAYYLDRGVITSQELNPKLHSNHPAHFLNGLEKMLVTAKTAQDKMTAGIHLQEFKRSLGASGIDWTKPAEEWPVGRFNAPKVGDAGAPAIIKAKLKNIAPELDSDSITHLLGLLAQRSDPNRVVRTTYELTSGPVSAQKLKAAISPVKEGGRVLFESMKRAKPLQQLLRFLESKGIA